MKQPSDLINSSNVPEFSVTELSYSLKKTLEDTYGRVRVRGELSRVKIHSSGHMYSDLKDDNSCLSLVCWKGQVSRLQIKPEEGLEVICTGRISSYPARSSYQLIVETMELAGEGALLKMLEERRKKLAAEGLFDAERKKALPFLPEVIGVVTSPTGAVIRDIMHRLDDRFPRHVLLWPALVQGDGAAEQIAAAIRGFDAMGAGGTVPKPDLLIVGRGGGSLEDLMPFNEEIVVRAVAECSIPVISAVGHETDTTLMDHVADMRAPTPTAAAEMAVPRRIDIWNGIQECVQRIARHADRALSTYSDRLESFSARLGDPARILEMREQGLDHLSDKLTGSFRRKLEAREAETGRLSARLVSPRQMLENKAQDFQHQFHKLKASFGERLSRYEYDLDHHTPKPPAHIPDRAEEALKQTAAPLKRLVENRLTALEREWQYSGNMLETLSYNKILERGFVVVRDQNGQILSDASQTRTGQNIQLGFRNDKQVGAVVTGSDKKPAAAKKAVKGPAAQEELF